jgi:hypothetical protein
MQSNEFVLTRYLYSKIEVAQSLLMALLDRQSDEALFWAYELYYSGLEEYALYFLYQLFDMLYEEKNPKLRDFVYQTPVDECHFGSIVMTLVYREYNLSKFIRDYFCRNASIMPTPTPPKKQLRIHLQSKDIEKYQTQTVSPARNTLNQVCRFPIRYEVLALFNTDVPENRVAIYHGSDKWLEYAAISPVWEIRIREHNGILNEDGHLFFQSDEDKESFYELWGYEPDEQSKEIQQFYMGKHPHESLTVEQFANQYGYSLLSEKKEENKSKKKVFKIKKTLKNTLLPMNEPINKFHPGNFRQDETGRLLTE